ncbi:hypothetical protein ANAPC5_01130 [Anaplasma phagocytophilum]|nr:hypothetical protein ANAPC5_01130 [Anaplasma phagocytophilum]
MCLPNRDLVPGPAACDDGGATEAVLLDVSLGGPHEGGRLSREIWSSSALSRRSTTKNLALRRMVPWSVAMM